MFKIKVKISETKYRSFYKTLVPRNHALTLKDTYHFNLFTQKTRDKVEFEEDNLSKLEIGQWKESWTIIGRF